MLELRRNGTRRLIGSSGRLYSSGVDLLAELNPEQRAAASHEGGPLLVIAGAGTGKTMTLAARLAWLAHRGADPQRLLLMTFSRRAAAEMARRAGRLLHRSLGLPASTPPPHLPWCGTFHGVAARLLREEAPRVGLVAGYTVLDRADAQDLMALTRQSLGLAQSEQRFPLAPTCLAILSRCVNTRVPLAQVLADDYPWCAAHEAELARLHAAYAAAKRQQQALDYDDLLLAWWHLMQVPALAEAIRARWDEVLVDEVQDVNRLQSELLVALRPQGRGLTAVGDDAQSIYAFRGADVRHILDLPRRWEPPARVLTLEQNYRSTPQILAASNAVIALAAERYEKTLRSDRAAGCLPRLHLVDDEAAQARGVADAVLAQRETGLALKRQAVLFRTSHHSMALELELVRRGIPYVKFGGLRFLEAAHVKDVLAVLRWADNPASTLSMLRSARLVPGMGPASVRRLIDHAGALADFRAPPAAARTWADLVDLIEHLRGDAARWPDDLARVVDWYEPHAQRLHDDAAVRLADLRQLARIAAGHSSRLRFVTELTLDPPEASSDEAGPPHRDEDYLILSTIHSAKGQEWNAVHVLNVVDGCMPADLATGRTAEIEEERRLLYVAMTRARDELSLWMPQRFHVGQQRAWGDRHLYALRSRFIPDALLANFESVGPAAPAPESAAPPAAEPLIDLAALLGAGAPQR
ncbi:MAG: ATP-dependent helicase [Burkholderiales bacterium]|nr:ATP-dependent helicase [Burkholderiales bacterium]